MKKPSLKTQRHLLNDLQFYLGQVTKLKIKVFLAIFLAFFLGLYPIFHYHLFASEVITFTYGCGLDCRVESVFVKAYDLTGEDKWRSEVKVGIFQLRQTRGERNSNPGVSISDDKQTFVICSSAQISFENDFPLVTINDRDKIQKINLSNIKWRKVDMSDISKMPNVELSFRRAFDAICNANAEKFPEAIGVATHEGRQINLHRYSNTGRAIEDNDRYLPIRYDIPTILTIHGLNNDDKDISRLTTKLVKLYPDHQILSLDWSPASKDPTPHITIPNISLGPILYFLFPDKREIKIPVIAQPFPIASRISPISNNVKEMLEDFKLSNNLILVGHSLGALMSSEIARLIGEGDDIGKGGIKALVAIDPAYPARNYDIDFNQSERQLIKNFRDVTDRSLSIVADESKVLNILPLISYGDNNIATTAHFSLLADFDDHHILPPDRHGKVIDTFIDASEKRYICLNRDNFNLPSPLMTNMYDASTGAIITDPKNRPDGHEIKISVNDDGTIRRANYFSEEYTQINEKLFGWIPTLISKSNEKTTWDSYSSGCYFE